MDSFEDFVDFIEFFNYYRRFRESGPRKYLRDYANPFEKYSVSEFYSRFRFTPHAVLNTLLPMFEPDLKKTSRRGLPFAPEIMLLLTLRFFATGSFQKHDEITMNVCQQSVSRIITKVSILIASKLRDFVKLPSTFEEINVVKQNFFEIANFPGVIGCIDCTHIKIRSPGGENAEVYKNRQGWFSIIVQVVTGPNLEFYDIVTRWPGSCHDNFIYENSSIKQRLNTGVLQGVLLGDSGYAVSDVMLTPFLSPNSESQERYNKSHIKTRNSIKRAFSIWKKKFPCLQEGMAIKVDTVVAVVCACATLYNIALKINDINCEVEDTETLNDIDVQPMEEYHNSGITRQSVVESFFSK